MNKQFWRNTVLAGFGALTMVSSSGCASYYYVCGEIGRAGQAWEYAAMGVNGAVRETDSLVINGKDLANDIHDFERTWANPSKYYQTR